MHIPCEAKIYPPENDDPMIMPGFIVAIDVVNQQATVVSYFGTLNLVSLRSLTVEMKTIEKWIKDSLCENKDEES